VQPCYSGAFPLAPPGEEVLTGSKNQQLAFQKRKEIR
jgi:hypothetical protein